MNTNNITSPHSRISSLKRKIFWRNRLAELVALFPFTTILVMWYLWSLLAPSIYEEGSFELERVKVITASDVGLGVTMLMFGFILFF